MKVMTALVLLAVVAAATAQYVSSYAPKGHQYPRPKGESESDLPSRFGGENQPAVNEQGFSMTQISDAEKYPEERRPFWYKNMAAIASHIGLNRNVANANPSPSTPANTN